MILKVAFLAAAMLFQQAAPAPSGGALAGNVKYADGTPYARSILFAQPLSETGKPLDTPSFIGASTSDTGDFRIPNVPPGRYAIRTSDSAAYFPGVTTLAAATVLSVTAGSVTENLNFVLPAAMTGFRVSGRVIRAANSQEPATRVSGSSGSQNVYGVIAGDGTFELLHVRAGTYSLQISPSVDMRPIRVVVDRDLAAIEFAMPRQFDIAGSVVIEGRTSPAGLFDARGGIPLMLSFDGPTPSMAGIQPDGTFKVSLPEGDYRILADRVPAGYYIKTIVSGPRDLISNRFQVRSSEEPVPIAVTLAPSPGVKVSGKVTGPIGNLSSARVALTGTVVRNVYDAAIRPDGSYALPLLMPGSYVARVTSSDAAASPPVPVLIPNRDVANLEIAVPPPVNVSGRITVDGSGPPPRFTLLLTSGSIPDWNSSLGDESVAALQREARTGRLQVLKIDVDALPDGSFGFQLPVGEYQAATAREGIPSPYVLTSLSYAGTNLLVDSLKVSDKESSELLVGFGTASQSPWSRVSGKVIGLEPGRGPFRVALEGTKTSTIEAPVAADGSFEFASVLQNSTYTALLMPKNEAATSPRVTVGTKDVDKVEIVVPHEREITLRTVVEGNAPVPTFVMSLVGDSSTVSILVKPDSFGASRMKLPEDERNVRISALPLGYNVKSLMVGPTDLRTCVQPAPQRCSYPPLKLAGNVASEIQLTLTLDPAVPFGRFSGRITGLRSDAGDVRLELRDATTFSTFEVNVGEGGSFSFAKLPQGTYVPSLELSGGAKTGLLNPSLVNVNGIDTSGIVITVPEGSARTESQPAVAEAPTGARVSELAGGSRSAAREAAAVATLRTITTAEVTYLAMSRGNFGTLQQMIDAKLLPESFRGTVSGFRFGITSVGSDFVAAAIPSDPDSAKYGFYVTADGIVRYSTIEFLAPAGQSGVPVN